MFGEWLSCVCSSVFSGVFGVFEGEVRSSWSFFLREFVKFFGGNCGDWQKCDIWWWMCDDLRCRKCDLWMYVIMLMDGVAVKSYLCNKFSFYFNLDFNVFFFFMFCLFVNGIDVCNVCGVWLCNLLSRVLYH